MSEVFARLDDFLDYMSAVKGRSAGTIRQYRYDLILFFRFLENHDDLSPEDAAWQNISLAHIDDAYLQSIKLSHFYKFISWLSNQRDAKPATRARRIAALRSFFKYLSDITNVLDTNIADKLESPKRLKRLPVHLSLTESQELLATASMTSKANSSARDYLIITLFLNCGLRLSELCSIDLGNIHEDTLRVIGKGGKERTIYLNGACMAALADYYPQRQIPKKGSEKALFISRLGKRLTPRAVENIIKKYLVLAGLDPAVYSTHKLRHTAATLMYQYGEVDIRSLQAILGHASVATTEIYTHIDDKKLHEAVENNPLSQLRKKKPEESEKPDDQA